MKRVHSLSDAEIKALERLYPRTENADVRRQYLSAGEELDALAGQTAGHRFSASSRSISALNGPSTGAGFGSVSV